MESEQVVEDIFSDKSPPMKPIPFEEYGFKYDKLYMKWSKWFLNEFDGDYHKVSFLENRQWFTNKLLNVTYPKTNVCIIDEEHLKAFWKMITNTELTK